MPHKGARRRQGVGAAAAYGRHIVIWLDNIPRARKQQQMFPIGQQQHGLKFAQILVLTPVLGHFHGRTHKIAALFLQFGFKQFEKGEGIGRCARKTGQHPAFVQAAHLAR